MSTSLNITVEELEKVLSGTSINKNEFLVRLSQIKVQGTKGSPDLMGDYQKSFVRMDSGDIKEGKIVHIDHLRNRD